MEDEVMFAKLSNTAPVKPKREKKRRDNEFQLERLIEEKETGEEIEQQQRKKTLKQRLSLAKLRIQRPDLSRILRPDFPRFFHNVGRIRNGFVLSCVKVEQEEEVPVLENMDVERRRSIDLGIRRSSLTFWRRTTVCQHPYHPYTPKQVTRFVWDVHHH